MRSLLRRIAPPLLLAGTAAACADLDTARTSRASGTVGEELYGIVCDRVGAQALREDLDGSSFRAICHKRADGSYADDVDASRLPPLDGTLKDVDGNVVPLEKQQAWRTYAFARIGAMARRRASLIAAFDSTFPDVRIPVVDGTNDDPAKSCKLVDDGAAGPRGRFAQQLSDLLGRLQPLYNDGTLPHTTQAMGKLMNDIHAADAARQGLARFEARRGYKPLDVEQGALRPVLAYPGLRDFANAALRLLSADSDPYALSPSYDGRGRRIPVAGPAHAQFSKFLEVTHEELRTFTPDPWAPAPASSTDAQGRPILSRPRTTLEVVDALIRMQDASFSQGDAPLFLTQRDSRGFAAVPRVGGKVPSPFTDPGNTGLPALDDLGQFITENGQLAPSPFPAPQGGVPIARDAAGRALVAANGSPVYASIDTSQTFANALMKNLPPLVDPDPKRAHETLMNLIAGLEVLSGLRDGADDAVREYSADPSRVDDWKLAHPNQDPPPDLATRKVTVKYNAYHRESAALLDLIWAAGSVLGDPIGDDALALVQKLLQEKVPTVARLAGTGLALKAIADKYDNAHIPPTSTLWDEILDQLVEIEKEPMLIDGKTLLEDLLSALGNDQVAGLGPVFANQMKYADRLTYDPDHINASPALRPPSPLYNETIHALGAPQTPVDRSKPDSGTNRSMFQRFAQLIADTHGIMQCNKTGGVVHARGIPVLGQIDIPLPIDAPLVECSALKVDDIASFFLDSIVHKATMYVRYDTLRDGINIGVTHLLPSTTSQMELSTNLTGFWGSRDPYNPSFAPTNCGAGASPPCPFMPTPNLATRMEFFHRGDPKNPITDRFVSDLLPPHVATTRCPERDVLPEDPCKPGNRNGCTACENRWGAGSAMCQAVAPIASDGKLHGLRQCKEGDWLDQRDDYTLFLTEQDDFYDHIRPLLVPLAKRNREDIFIKLMTSLDRHWQTQGARSGASSYEPLLVEQLAGDLLPMLHDTIKVLQDPAFTIPHCTAVDPRTHTCTAQVPWTGMQVLLSGVRTLLDPTISANRKVTHRDGSVQGLRNDGSKNPQVTPMYLVLGALNAFDAAFDQWNAKHPNDARLGSWRSARSQLVDQFFTVNGSGTASTFANPVVAPALPKIVQLLREQLLAHCPDSFVETPAASKNAPVCAWARQEITNKLGDITSGPLFGSALDVVSAIRQDAPARGELEKLLLYLLDPKSPHAARNTLLTTLVDFPQLLADDGLTPVIHALSDGASASLADDDGNVVRTGLVDALTAVLARLTGRAYAEDGTEHCGRELDPNQVLTSALRNLVTPMKAAPGEPPQTPLEVIIDAIADVNRVNPDDASKLKSPDYASMTSNVSQFLLDRDRGLEQFYAIVREGTMVP